MREMTLFGAHRMEFLDVENRPNRFSSNFDPRLFLRLRLLTSIVRHLNHKEKGTEKWERGGEEEGKEKSRMRREKGKREKGGRRKEKRKKRKKEKGKKREKSRGAAR